MRIEIQEIINYPLSVLIHYTYTKPGIPAQLRRQSRTQLLKRGVKDSLSHSVTKMQMHTKKGQYNFTANT